MKLYRFGFEGGITPTGVSIVTGTITKRLGRKGSYFHALATSSPSTQASITATLPNGTTVVSGTFYTHGIGVSLSAVPLIEVGDIKIGITGTNEWGIGTAYEQMTVLTASLGMGLPTGSSITPTTSGSLYVSGVSYPTNMSGIWVTVNSVDSNGGILSFSFDSTNTNSICYAGNTITILGGDGLATYTLTRSNVVCLSPSKFSWTPIKFSVDFTNKTATFGIGTNTAQTLSFISNSSSVTTIKINGVYGSISSLLDDIAINDSTGTVDTGIPEYIACSNMVTTGVGSSNEWNPVDTGTIPRNSIVSPGYAVSFPNTQSVVTSCEPHFTSTVDFPGGSAFPGAGTIYIMYDDGNGTVNNLIETHTTAKLITSGVADASINPTTAWNAFDNNSTTSWNSGTTKPSSGTPVTLTYKFYGEKKVTSYSITTKAAEAANAPKAFTFLGSRDGSTWVTLDTRTNITGWNNTTGETRTFTIDPANANRFTSYRLSVTDINTTVLATPVKITALQMSGVSYCDIISVFQLEKYVRTPYGGAVLPYMLKSAICYSPLTKRIYYIGGASNDYRTYHLFNSGINIMSFDPYNPSTISVEGSICTPIPVLTIHHIEYVPSNNSLVISTEVGAYQFSLFSKTGRRLNCLSSTPGRLLNSSTYTNFAGAGGLGSTTFDSNISTLSAIAITNTDTPTLVNFYRPRRICGIKVSAGLNTSTYTALTVKLNTDSNASTLFNYGFSSSGSSGGHIMLVGTSKYYNFFNIEQSGARALNNIARYYTGSSTYIHGFGYYNTTFYQDRPKTPVITVSSTCYIADIQLYSYDECFCSCYVPSSNTVWLYVAQDQFSGNFDKILVVDANNMDRVVSTISLGNVVSTGYTGAQTDRSIMYRRQMLYNPSNGQVYLHRDDRTIKSYDVSTYANVANITDVGVQGYYTSSMTMHEPSGTLLLGRLYNGTDTNYAITVVSPNNSKYEMDNTSVWPSDLSGYIYRRSVAVRSDNIYIGDAGTPSTPSIKVLMSPLSPTITTTMANTSKRGIKTLGTNKTQNFIMNNGLVNGVPYISGINISTLNMIGKLSSELGWRDSSGTVKIVSNESSKVTATNVTNSVLYNTGTTNILPADITSMQVHIRTV